MPTVYLLEETRLDTASLRDFGPVKTIWKPGERRATIWSDQFVESTLQKMFGDGYKPEIDLFAVAGHIVPLMRVVTALVLLGRQGAPRLLYFSSTERRYIERGPG